MDAITVLRPMLRPLCARVTHMGMSGAGQMTKLCDQMIVATNLLVIAEMISMVRLAGIEVAALPGALTGGFADSLPLQIFGQRMAAHRLEPRLGALALMAKDVRLAIEVSHDYGARTPSLTLAGELYALARKLPDIKDSTDISCLIRLFESPPTKVPP